MGYQTRDLLAAMQADMGGAGDAVLRDRAEATFRVDGGMSASEYAMHFLSDIIGAQVDRPKVLETTAPGCIRDRRSLPRNGRWTKASPP